MTGFNSLRLYKSPKSVQDVSIKGPSSAFGELLVSELSPIFQQSFEYTVDNTQLNENIVQNGGNVTQTTAMAKISTSTTTIAMHAYRVKDMQSISLGWEGYLDLLQCLHHL